MAEILVISDDAHLSRLDHKQQEKCTLSRDEILSSAIMPNALFHTWNEWWRSITPRFEVDISSPTVVTMAMGKQPVEKAALGLG
ncbi:hypothetical protein H257_08558 [Aphanomyces astaci]|uniref:Uncharacterized protein n=1 Tax=Aphanomyces astaci TaxID=112090 RepID=W4GFD8_APHAT|nr:hypothetical protein H257_08558 [Aphanomyces astaci]ETV77668.1 hypothetical protein H257_08558 [Aphanomyces astaci]|eukprot:XP_009832778.1 hypothetical protein H257_08558 [Aphanomyces astaci]